jgi:predicted Fe-Mo cluster-binding NifX family protein
MAVVIVDCRVLVCLGMGMGVYESMKARGIRPVVTDIVSIEEAVTTCLDDRLVKHADYFHSAGRVFLAEGRHKQLWKCKYMRSYAQAAA